MNYFSYERCSNKNQLKNPFIELIIAKYIMQHLLNSNYYMILIYIALIMHLLYFEHLIPLSVSFYLNRSFKLYFYICCICIIHTSIHLFGLPQYAIPTVQTGQNVPRIE